MVGDSYVFHIDFCGWRDIIVYNILFDKQVGPGEGQHDTGGDSGLFDLYQCDIDGDKYLFEVLHVRSSLYDIDRSNMLINDPF